MEADSGELARMVWSRFRHPVGSQGRPAHPAAIFVLSWVGSRLGGLPIMYLLGYLILTANACLFFLLLRRMKAPDTVAVPAVVAYCLFPADTSQSWLTITFGAQPSITAVLLAFHSFLSHRLVAVYLLGAFILGQYETVFPVLLAAPLLNWKRNSRPVAGLLRHAGILAVMVLAVFALRVYIGEGRAAGLDLTTALTWPLRQMMIGPIVAMATFFHRPVTSLFEAPSAWALALAICFAGTATLLYGLCRPSSEEDPKQMRLRQLASLAGTGLVWLVLAYPLSFTRPAEVITDRFSRVHMPAVLGASLLVGCLCSAVLLMVRPGWCRGVATASIALLFTGLMAFGFRVQEEYVLAWRYQRAFWTDVTQLTPDINPNTAILYELHALKQPEHMQAFSWAMAEVPGFLYRFPPSSGPVAVSLHPDWRSIFSATGDIRQALNTHQSAASILADIPSPEFIILEADDGRLARRGGPPAVDASPPPTRLLHRLLVLSPDEKPAEYLR